MIVDTFVYDYTIDHGIFYKAFDFLIENDCNYGTILADMLCEKAQWNRLLTADYCKQMLLLGEFH